MNYDLSNNSIYQLDLKYFSNLNLNWKSLKNKSVLVTGATGLIGSYLIDLLMYRNLHFHDNISVFALGRNETIAKERFIDYFNTENFNFIKNDISTSLNFDFDFDYIIHGAGNANPKAFLLDPTGTMKGIFYGMNNILEYAQLHQCQRILFISSGEVYGKGDESEFSENISGNIDISNFRSCYPSAKRAAETLGASYIKQYDINLVIVRPCHIYGATFTKSENRVWAQFLKNALNKQPISIKSKGLQRRSFCYVGDCVYAILMTLLEGEKGETYNIANNESVATISEMAKVISKLSGQETIYEIPYDQGKVAYSENDNAVLSDTKIKQLGWIPLFDLNSGFERTYKILKEYY